MLKYKVRKSHTTRRRTFREKLMDQHRFARGNLNGAEHSRLLVSNNLKEAVLVSEAHMLRSPPG